MPDYQSISNETSISVSTTVYNLFETCDVDREHLATILEAVKFDPQEISPLHINMGTIALESHDANVVYGQCAKVVPELRSDIQEERIERIQGDMPEVEGINSQTIYISLDMGVIATDALLSSVKPNNEEGRHLSAPSTVELNESISFLASWALGHELIHAPIPFPYGLEPEVTEERLDEEEKYVRAKTEEFMNDGAINSHLVNIVIRHELSVPQLVVVLNEITTPPDGQHRVF